MGTSEFEAHVAALGRDVAFGQRIDALAEELAAHYGVDVARVQWERPGECRSLGHTGRHRNIQPAPAEGRTSFEVFCHHVNRRLPIIIEDASRDPDHAQRLTVEGSRYAFCVSAPLVLGKDEEKIGAITLLGVDARQGFGFKECAFLEEKAIEVVALLETMAAAEQEEKEEAAPDCLLEPEMEQIANSAALCPSLSCLPAFVGGPMIRSRAAGLSSALSGRDERKG